MPRALKTYGQWRLEKLSNPQRAAKYLNAAKRDSKEAFLHALKNVIQANRVARIAREAGVSRESVYRSFSSEGNPTFDTLSSVLEALNIKIQFVPVETSPPSKQTAGSVQGIVTDRTGRVEIGPSANASRVVGFARISYPSLTIQAGAVFDYAPDAFGYTSSIAMDGTPDCVLPNALCIGSKFLPGFLQQQQIMQHEKVNE